MHGTFTYCLTIVLPSTHVFVGHGQRLELKESFYAKAEPTEEEKKEAEKSQLARHAQRESAVPLKPSTA